MKKEKRVLIELYIDCHFQVLAIRIDIKAVIDRNMRLLQGHLVNFFVVSVQSPFLIPF